MKWLLVLVVACGGKPEPTAGTSAPSSEVPAELAAWMPSDAAKLWQGSFTTPLVLNDSLAGPAEAVLDVKDGGAKAFDGASEYPLGFTIVAPCIADFEQITGADNNAIVPTTRKFFAIRNGELVVSFGGLGVRKGKAAIVCQPGVDAVVTVDDKGACRSWEKLAGWKSKPIACAWGKTDDGADRLVVDKIEFVADGDLLMDVGARVELRHATHQRHASYEAAKQALAAHQAARRE